MRHNAQKRAKRRGDSLIPNGFERAYYNLTVIQMDEMREKIMKELGWKVSRFYYRMRGKYSFSPDEIQALTIMFAELGINAWTGERTFINTNEPPTKTD